MAGQKRKAKPEAGLSAAWRLTPEYRAATLVAATDRGGDVVELTGELIRQTRAIQGGSLDRPADILAAQAHSLDGLFNTLARIAVQPGNGANAERLLRLAFRAQAQCARTVEVLANLKNPPVVYAQQANISQGHQQVNNGIPAQAREKVVTEGGGGGAENGHNQLLGGTHELLPDARAPGIEGRIDPQMEAVGAFDRA